MVDMEAFHLKAFKTLYEAILHVVHQVELLDLWVPSFSISHPDLTTNNILVSYGDPTCILGIMDWEGARIKPWVNP
jgi:aminoglycoside phosphotransferase (APT) family kinase protein